jgi:hypothetical protein
MKAVDIVALLKKKYKHEVGWLFITELRRSPGWIEERTIDVFVLHQWPSEGFKRIAYEIKISNSDFKREIKQPQKRKSFRDLSNEFYFIAPEGIIDPDKVPTDCGLIEVTPEGKLIKKIDSPWFESNPDWNIVASLVKRALEMEAIPRQVV